MARTDDLSAKIKVLNKKTGQVEEQDYDPQIRNKLKDIQKNGVAKVAGWAVGAGKSAAKTSASWAARRVLGNTIGGVISNKIDSLDTSSGSKGIINSIQNLKTEVVAELRDLTTSEKSVADKLATMIEQDRDDSVDLVLSKIDESLKKYTSSGLGDKSAERLSDSVKDAYSRALGGNDTKNEISKIKEGFISRYIHVHPNEDGIPKRVEKDLDSVLKAVEKQIDLEKAALSKAELSQKNQELLLQKLVDGQEEGSLEESIKKQNDISANYNDKEKVDDAKKGTIGDLLAKWFPVLGGALTSLTGMFRSLPETLIKGLSGLLAGAGAMSALKTAVGSKTILGSSWPQKDSSGRYRDAKGRYTKAPSLMSKASLKGTLGGILGGAALEYAGSKLEDNGYQTAGDLSKVAGLSLQVGSILGPQAGVATAAGGAGFVVGQSLTEWADKKLAPSGYDSVADWYVGGNKFKTPPIQGTKNTTADSIQKSQENIEKAIEKKAFPAAQTINTVNNTNITNKTGKTNPPINPSRNQDPSIQRVADRLSFRSLA